MITRFKHLVMHCPDVPEPSSDLAPVEALVDGPLPADFAEFLRVANGRLVFYDLVVGSGKKPRVLPFHLVLELGPERSKRWPTTIAGVTKAARLWGAPASFIKFGYHTSMATLYYDVPPRGTGRVLISFTDNNKFRPVAESFEQYVLALRLNHQRVLELLQMAADGGEARGISNLREWLDAAVPDWRSRWEVPDDVM